jgi:monovalent cation:H+ antiporter-2, CPA2 family
MVIALPVAFQARRVLELARAANPGIDIAVRAHVDEEVAFMAGSGAAVLVVMGEPEVALSTCDYALRCFGLDTATARSTVASLRAAMPGGDTGGGGA